MFADIQAFLHTKAENRFFHKNVRLPYKRQPEEIYILSDYSQ